LKQNFICRQFYLYTSDKN